MRKNKISLAPFELARGGEVLLRAAERVDTFGGVVASSLNPLRCSDCPARSGIDGLFYTAAAFGSRGSGTAAG
jgi:hypothetical protein